MDAYKRAYKDPKSPLTPLTPLSNNAAFRFDFGGDNSLKDVIKDVKFTPPSPTTAEEDSTELQESLTEEQSSGKNIDSIKLIIPTISHQFSAEDLFKMRLVCENPAKACQSCRQAVQAYMSKISTCYCLKVLTPPISVKSLSPRVAQCLDHYQLGHLKRQFEEQEVDLEVLSTLDEQDVKALGITPLTQRCRLLCAAKMARKLLTK